MANGVLAPLASTDTEDDRQRQQRWQALTALNPRGDPFTVLGQPPSERGIPGQIVAGIQRGAFGVGATFGEALGVLFPDTGKGITDFFHSYQMQSSGKMIEQAAETATESLGVLGAAALGVTAAGVPALTGLGVGTLSAIAAPAVFGLAQATQTRDLLQAINQEVTRRGGQPLTSGEIAAAMATNGAIEFGGEFISDILFAKRFFPGSTAFQGAKDAVRAYLVNPEVNAAVRLVARATEESVRAGAREAPEEFLQNVGEAAVTRGIVGPERLRQAQAGGIQVPGAAIEEGFQAAKVALVAGPFFAAGGAVGSRLLRGRQGTPAPPQEQQSSATQAAAVPPPTSPAPVVSPPPAGPPTAQLAPTAPGRTQGPGFEILGAAEAARAQRQAAGATIPQPPGAPSRQRATIFAQLNPDEYLEMTGRIGASVDTATLMQDELFPITVQAFQQGLRPNDIQDPIRRQQFLDNLEAAFHFYQEQPPAPVDGGEGIVLPVGPGDAMPLDAIRQTLAQSLPGYGGEVLPVEPGQALSGEELQQRLDPTRPLPTAVEAGLQRRADVERFAGTPVIGVRPRVEAAPAVLPVPVQAAGIPGAPRREETPQASPGVAAPTVGSVEAVAPPPAAIAPLPAAQQAMLPDLVSALRNLGYSTRDATAAAQAALAQQPASLEDAIALALRPKAAAISRAEAPAAQPHVPQTPETAERSQAPRSVPPSVPEADGPLVYRGFTLRPIGGGAYDIIDTEGLEGQQARGMRLHTTRSLEGAKFFVDREANAFGLPPEPTPQQARAQQTTPPLPPSTPPGIQQPVTGQQTLVDTSQLTEQERATQAQITRESVEAEAGTRLRPTVEQAPPTGLFEQEQALPFQAAPPPSIQQTQAVEQPEAPTLPRDAPTLGRALADIYAGPLQRMTEQGLTLAQMHTVIANELRERYGTDTLDRTMQAVAGAGFTGDNAMVRFIDNAIDQVFGLPSATELQQQVLRDAEEGRDILAVIRQADPEGRFGIRLPTKGTPGTLRGDFEGLIRITQGGRRQVARLLNNRSGLTPQEMANRLADLGYLPEASEEVLLDHLRERLGTGRQMGPRYRPGGLAEPLASFSRIMRRPTPGGDRADATPTTKRQAAAIPARLEHIADGETIIATTMQAELGRRVAIPGVRRREETIEVVRTIPPHPVIEEMRVTGSVAFVGQTIRPGQAGTRDIAVIGQLVRDPEIEHLHYLLTDEAGRVVRVIEVSSRLPGSGAPFVKVAGQPLGPGFMAKGMRDLQTQMRQAGATGFWMLHNHPSGNPAPSQADVNFTRHMAAVSGFQGHVVIDSGRYATITAAGEKTIAPLEAVGPDPFLQPSLGVPFAGIPIQSTADAAAVGRALATPGFMTLVLLNKRPTGPDLGVRGVLLVPEGAITQSHDQMKTYIESLESEFGAVLATAYYDGTNPSVHTAAEMLYRDGVLTDYVMAMPQGGEVSLAEELPELAPDRRLVQARRLEAAAGERVEEEPPGLNIPNSIQGVTVAQAGKLATAYRMMFDVGHSLHSSHIQRPLSQATFQKLRIRWAQMEDIGQQMLLRFMQHPEDLDAIRRRIQRDPTAGLSTAENAGLVQWTMVMMDDLDVKRSLGEIDQATFDQEWDAIIKNALLIPAAASSAGRTLALQRRFQQVGSYTITDFLRREERARGRVLTDDERRQRVGDFFDVLRTGDRDQIRDRLEKETDPALLDYYWEAYYGSLLSGLPTLNMNTFGTLAHITFQKFVVGPTAVGLDWMISAFSGQERQRYMQEVFADFNATWKNAGHQYREAWYWWKSPLPRGIGGVGQLAQPTGALRRGFALTRGGMRLDAGSGADAWMRAPLQNQDGTPNRWGPVMRRLAPFVGAASRVMAATDAVATNLAFQGEVAKLATREGIRRFGIQDSQQVDNFVEHVQTHLVQYPEIESGARAAAQSSTFNDPAGALARALLGVRRAPQPFGFFFRLLTPFANTPDRLLARGAELVPLLGLPVGYREAGYTGRAGFAGNFRGWLADVRQGEPQAVEVAAKQVVGLMLSSMAALLWDKDLLTGPLPTEPQERQAWERQGKLPFAIRMGENWIEYRRVEPFLSAPFGALTAGLQAIKTMRDNRLHQGLALDYSYMDDASSVAAGMAFNMTRFILDSSYFSGLASFFESTARTSQGFATGLTQQLVSATLPLSGLLRNLNRTIEASGMLGTEPGVVLMRQRERVGEQFLRSIPGAATSVRPRLDVFGQPVVSERPLLGAVGGLLSPIRRQVAQEDPVEAAFERLQFRPGRPPRRQLETVVGRRIEDEEYDAYATRRGALARETIERIVGLPFFAELPQDKQRARLQQAFSQATRRARREVFGRPETTQERRTRFAEAALAAASGE